MRMVWYRPQNAGELPPEGHFIPLTMIISILRFGDLQRMFIFPCAEPSFVWSVSMFSKI